MMTRRLTSAFIVALAVSGGFTFWLSQKVSKTKPAPPPAKNQYIAASTNLDAGQVIRAENLKFVDWPAAVPLPGAFVATQPLIGRVVLYPLSAGEPIEDRQLATVGAAAGITVKIPDGMRAISLRTDEIVGVAGFLLPGTHVDVLVTLHSTSSPDPVTTTVLQDVQILAAGQKTEPDPLGAASTATVVTLLVKPADAERVVLASSQGTVHFVLRNGDDRKAVDNAPVMLSQLATGLAPTPVAASAPRAQRALPLEPKPYVVETVLGTKQRMDSF